VLGLDRAFAKTGQELERDIGEGAVGDAQGLAGSPLNVSLRQLIASLGVRRTPLERFAPVRGSVTRAM
jgi:hypothetical protein